MNLLQVFYRFLTTDSVSSLTMIDMSSSHRIGTIVCTVALCFFGDGEAPAAEAAGAATQGHAAELQLLQGTWEGFPVGNPQEKITITITGNSFHFHRDTNFWFETSIALPPGTDPKQLHATIKRCPPSQADSIGKVVGAIFKIEDGTLTLATGGEGADEEGTPKQFAATADKGQTRFQLRKVRPKEKNTRPSKTN